VRRALFKVNTRTTKATEMTYLGSVITSVDMYPLGFIWHTIATVAAFSFMVLIVFGAF
jgi:hypothetical protein